MLMLTFYLLSAPYVYDGILFTDILVLLVAIYNHFHLCTALKIL